MQVQWSVAKQHPAQTESIFKVNPFRIQHGHVSPLWILFFPDSWRAEPLLFRKTLSIWWHASVLCPSQRFFRLEWWLQWTRMGNWTDWSPAASLVWPWNRGLSSTARSGSLTFIYLFIFMLEGPAVCSAGRFHGDERALPWLVILCWRLQEG